MKLSLEALEVIEAIDRKGSYAAAAAALNRVPSAVSYTVQKLEQDLEVTLFQREGRRAVLTKAGRHLVDQGRQLLQAADELAASTRQVATGWEPRLRVAVDTIIPIATILPAVAALQEQHPAIEVTLTTEALAGTWEALLENRADLLVGGIGDIPGHQGVRCEIWRSIDYVFVAAPSHPLAQSTGTVTLEQIEQERAVVVRDTSRNSPRLSRGLLNQQNTLYVPTMEAKLEAHRLGLGVGYAPLPQVAEDLDQGRLVALTLPEPREPGDAVLAWKVSNRGRALHFLLDQLRELDE